MVWEVVVWEVVIRAAEVWGERRVVDAMAMIVAVAARVMEGKASHSVAERAKVVAARSVAPVALVAGSQSWGCNIGRRYRQHCSLPDHSWYGMGCIRRSFLHSS